MASCGDPAPDSPAADNRLAMPATPDHVSGVGPPGAAHSAITRRTPSIEPVCIAVTSIAASCARAPSGVRGKPVGTSAGPSAVARGNSMTPAACLDTGPGSASSGSAVGIGVAASASCGDSLRGGRCSLSRGVRCVRLLLGQHPDDRENHAGQDRQRHQRGDHDQREQSSRSPLRDTASPDVSAAAHQVHPLPVIESRMTRMTV